VRGANKITKPVSDGSDPALLEQLVVTTNPVTQGLVGRYVK
jgi:hypothetical protein